MPEPRFRALPRAGLALAVFLVAALAMPATASAYSSDELASAEVDVLAGVNRYRSARGLRPLLMDERVRKVARERSRSMARLGYFSHVAPNGTDASDLMRRDGIRHYLWGEAIGWTSFGELAYSVEWMLGWWRDSAPHFGLITSTRFNYVGVGIAETDSKLLYTIVFAQGPDRTRPLARGLQAQVPITPESTTDGTPVRLTWKGRDVPLAVRTSGLRDFRIQRRRAGGEWRTVVRSATRKSRSFLLAAGEYEFRVRSRDNAGNRSAWTEAIPVSVP